MESLFKAFKSTLFSDNSSPVILIHSSLIAAVKAEKKKLPYRLLQEIFSLSRSGITFAFPSYTFTFCSSQIFDVSSTKSETGILADLVHTNLPGSIRSVEPIYSHVFIGPFSKELASIQGKTTFGDGSIFERLEQLNAFVGVLNTGWEYATIFHRYEELSRVPYRYYKEFKGISRGYDGHDLFTKAKMYVRNLDINPENDMNLALPFLRECKSFKRFKDNSNILELIEIDDLRKVALSMLNDDEWSLVTNKTFARQKLFQIQARQSSPKYNIAIFGLGNIDPFGNKLRNYLSENIPSKIFNVWTSPFGQMFELILDKTSFFSENSFDMIISPANSSDFNFQEDISKFKFKAERYLDVIQFAVKSKNCRAILHRLDMPATARQVKLEQQIRERVDFYNHLLEEISNKNENILVVDQCMLSNQYGQSITDSRLFYIGKIGYSLPFVEVLVKSWVSYIVDLLGFSIRAIVLDLDNTLWGGVVGEDGVDQLQIGGDFPGNCFYNFQSFLVNLASQGIFLSIASKNNSADVESAFKNLKMPLKMDMFSSRKINWEEKHHNIKSIASELNIGLTSILFIDDNPAEREKIRHFLPEVHVLDLPLNPEKYIESLQKYLFLSAAIPVDQNTDRRKSIEISQKITELKSSTSENILNNYLKSLNITLSIEPLSASNLKRAEQLCQKTNQFNTTTTRYSASKLLEIDRSKNFAVILIGHQSNDQPYEVMGLIVVHIFNEKLIASIDSYLLSCRVLGRGIEETCIAWLTRKLYNIGMVKYVVGKVVPTRRNEPAQSFYGNIGFEKNSDGDFTYSVDKYESLALESYIKIQDNSEENLFS